jgi:hypothetical protein
MECAYHTDDDTAANIHSPQYVLPEFDRESIGLEDEKRLQMLEKHVGLNPEISSCKCHIASKQRYPKHARYKNNIVYASWMFHQYFDWLNTEGIIPCLLVRPEKVYTPGTFVIRGPNIKRHRIDVLMDFTTEAVLQAVMRTLHEGCELVNPKWLRTPMTQT